MLFPIPQKKREKEREREGGREGEREGDKRKRKRDRHRGRERGREGGREGGRKERRGAKPPCETQAVFRRPKLDMKPGSSPPVQVIALPGFAGMLDEVALRIRDADFGIPAGMGTESPRLNKGRGHHCVGFGFFGLLFSISV